MGILGYQFLQGVDNITGLWQAADASSARLHVVVNEPLIAIDMADRYKSSKIVLRIYDGDATDPHREKKYHRITTPQMLHDRFRFSYANMPNLYIQIMNEPSMFDDLPAQARFLAEIAELGSRDMVNYCLHNLPVGHPRASMVRNGELDVLLETLHRLSLDRNPVNHLYGIHYYPQDNPRSEHFRTVGEQGGPRIGLHLPIFERCDSKGWNRPLIAVTELGTDIGGGPRDGWQERMTAERYRSFLEECGRLCIDDGVYGTAIFGYGHGFSWHSFDVQKSPIILDGVRKFNKENPMSPPTNQSPVPALLQPSSELWSAPKLIRSIAKTAAGADATLNVRALPSSAGAIKGRVPLQSLNGKVYKPVLGPTDWTQVYLELEGGETLIGWCFESFLEVKPIAPPEEDNRRFLSMPEVRLTKGEVAWLRDLAANQVVYYDLLLSNWGQ